MVASVDQKSFLALPPGRHQIRLAARGVGFDAWVWRGEGDGPVVVVNGATHGDEYEGPTVLRRWARTWRPRRLRGAVVLIPVLNEGAFLAGLRCDPADDANLARAFPGSPRGTVTARLAHLFDTRVLAQATHYVDLHSAGRAYGLLPWTGYVTLAGPGNGVQRAMAACFDDFWCWEGPYLPGRTLSSAHDRGVPAIYVECQGRGGLRAADLRALDRGLRRLLVVLGSVTGRVPRPRRQLLRVTRDLDEAHLQVHHLSPADGLFAPSVAVGRRVRKGQGIGWLDTVPGGGRHEVRAEGSGRVVMLRHQPSVRRGEALCTLAPI